MHKMQRKIRSEPRNKKKMKGREDIKQNRSILQEDIGQEDRNSSDSKSVNKRGKQETGRTRDSSKAVK